jgi:ferredoxin
LSESTTDSGVSINVDRDVCIGSGMCVVYAPATFDQDGEAKAYVRDGSSESPEVIESAVEACPTGALSLGRRTA